MLSTASAGVMPTPAVVTVKSGTFFDTPNNSALLGFGAKGSLKATERDVQGSPFPSNPLIPVAERSVVWPIFPGQLSGRSMEKKPVPMPEEASTSNV